MAGKKRELVGIDIYVDGVYVCSSNVYRTCREAVQGFSRNPRWQAVPGSRHIDNIQGKKVVAHFSKNIS